MPRPLRPQWHIRTTVRRRHRTWVGAMTFATIGWGVWWIAVLLLRFAPNVAPSLTIVSWISCVFAVVGLFLGIFTIRARTIWVLLAGVPIFANGSLLALPFLVQDLEVHLVPDEDGARPADSNSF